MKIESEIRRQIVLVERREASREIISRAFAAHERTLRESRSLLLANARLLAEIRTGKGRLVEYADSEKEEDKGLFDRALDAFIDTSVEGLFRPTLNEILEGLGLSGHPKLRSIISQIITTSLTRLIRDWLSGKITYDQVTDCKVISETIALSTAEALPKHLIDSLIGGSGRASSGFVMTLREAIANYFADQETVKMIADGYAKFICEIDFRELFSKGAAEVQRATSKIGEEI